MNKYEGLKYKTLGNTSPRSKPRVYFCCHPDDFSQFFEQIAEEIQNIQNNAAIWYYDPAEGIPDGERFLDDLGRMQLFVIPVTHKFIFRDCRARTVEFAYAIEHHIPVLPLIQEPHLERDFNRVCGNLQYLDREASRLDPTVLPYEDKLKTFLGSVLLSDKLTEQIREAFDAYIFLSYRKKDRQYAQKIMPLIHDNEFCRDVAIWYDEFLIPGEDFNDAIAEALKKSKLFALVVTPNLLENPNYVMTTEYPEAKKAEKPILALESVRTDDKQLEVLYTGISERVSPEDRKALSEQLKKHLGNIVLQERDSSPKHLFFIGLAYLSGIDMETNHQRALSLITRAADQGLQEAYEKLVSMYNKGEGVERNYLIAAQWQQKYVDLLERTLPETNNKVRFLRALQDLGDMYKALGMQKESLAAYKRMVEAAQDMSDQSDDEQNRHRLLISYIRLGDLYEEQGSLRKAEEFYLRSLELCKTIVQSTHTQDNGSSLRSDLNICYQRIGNLCINRFKPSEAIDWYLKAYEISKSLAQEDPTSKKRRNLSIDCEKLVETYLHEDRPAEAEKYCRELLEINEALNEEIRSAEARRDLATGFEKMGDLCKATGDLSSSRQYYQKSVKLFEELMQQLQTLQSFDDLFNMYMKTGYICSLEGQFTETEKYYQKALDIMEALVDEVPLPRYKKLLSSACIMKGALCEQREKPNEAYRYYLRSLELSEENARESDKLEDRDLLSRSYRVLGVFCQRYGKTEKAEDYYLKSMHICEELAKNSDSISVADNLANSYAKMGTICQIRGNLPEAEKYCLQCYQLNKTIAGKTQTHKTRRSLAVSLSRLGDIRKAMKDPDGAHDYYSKSLEICEAIAQETRNPQAIDDLAISYLNLGTLGTGNDKGLRKLIRAKTSRQFLKSALQLFEYLAEQYPENPRYKKCKEEVLRHM